MANLRRAVALGNTPATRALKRTYKAVRQFHLPMPRPLRAPVRALFGLGRAAYYNLYRVLVCEPLFKAHCTEFGRNVTTGVFVHFITGTGDLVVGDDAIIDGKSTFGFGARFAERPRLEIGARTYVGHACSFSVASRVSVGSDCYIATGCFFLDSPGHPLDPRKRRLHLPPDPEQIKPVTIEDNVWIGTQAMVMPGVTIGRGSVVAARAVVTSDVPPYTVVGGTPARPLKKLAPTDVTASEPLSPAS
jgi:acetyltransferase-like isoleucine patch superfamily enzyme